MSIGSARGAQHGGDLDTRRRAHGVGERLGGQPGRGPPRRGVAHDDDHHLLRAPRTDPDDGGGR